MSLDIDINIVTTTIDDHISKITSIIYKKNFCIQEIKKLNEKIKEIEILKNSNNTEVLQIKNQLEDKENSLKDNIQLLKTIEKEIKTYKQKSYLEKIINEISKIITITDENLNDIQNLRQYHYHIIDSNKNIYSNFIKLKKELNQIKKLLSQQIFNNEKIIELVTNDFDLISKKCENKEEFIEEIKNASIDINSKYEEAKKNTEKVRNDIKIQRQSFISLFKKLTFDYPHALNMQKLFKERNQAIEEEKQTKNIAQLYILIVKFINELDFCKIRQLINLINNKLIILQKIEKIEQESNLNNIQEIIDEICELIIVPNKKLLNSITYTRSKLKEQNIHKNEIEELFNTEIKLNNKIVNELIEKISISLSQPHEIFNYKKIINFVTEKFDLIIEKCNNKKLLQKANEEAIEAKDEANKTRIIAIETRNETHNIRNEVNKAKVNSAQVFVNLSNPNPKYDNLLEEQILEEQILDKKLQEKEKVEEEIELLAETKEYTAQLKIYKVKYINEFNYCRIKELIKELIQKIIEEKDKKLSEKFDELKNYVKENDLTKLNNYVKENNLPEIINIGIEKLNDYITDIDKYDKLKLLIYNLILLLIDPIDTKNIQTKFDEIHKIISTAEENYKKNIKYIIPKIFNIQEQEEDIEFKEQEYIEYKEDKLEDTVNKLYDSLPERFDKNIEDEINEINRLLQLEIQLELNVSNYNNTNLLELEIFNGYKIIKLVETKLNIISEKCKNKVVEVTEAETEAETKAETEAEKEYAKNIKQIAIHKEKYIKDLDYCKINKLFEEIKTIIKPNLYLFEKEIQKLEILKNNENLTKQTLKIENIEPKFNMREIINNIEESILKVDVLKHNKKIKYKIYKIKKTLNKAELMKDDYINIKNNINEIIKYFYFNILSNYPYYISEISKIKEKFDNLKELLINSNKNIFSILWYISNEIQFYEENESFFKIKILHNIISILKLFTNKVDYSLHKGPNKFYYNNLFEFYKFKLLDYKVNDNTIIKTIETIDNIISELNCLNGNKSYYDGLKFQTLLLSEKSQERNEKMCLITDSFKELKEFIEPNFLEKEIQEIQKLEIIKPISKLKINIDMLEIIKDIEILIREENVYKQKYNNLENNKIINNIYNIKKALNDDELRYIDIKNYINEIINELGCDSLYNKEFYLDKNVIFCKIKEKFVNLKELLIISNPNVENIINNIKNLITIDLQNFENNNSKDAYDKLIKIKEYNINQFILLIELIKNNYSSDFINHNKITIKKYDDIIITINEIIKKLNTDCTYIPTYKMCPFFNEFKELQKFIS
jgi:hypothetical protein